MATKSLMICSTIAACICASPRAEAMAADEAKIEKPAKIPLEDGGIAYGAVLNHCDGTLLSADDAQSGDLFGYSVAIGPGIAPEGDNMLIGAPSDDNVEGANAGAVYAFDKINGAWTQIQKLTPASLNPGDFLGCCIDLAGEHAIIGARHADPYGDDSGRVWTAQRLGGFWALQPAFTAWDGAAADQFGHAVSVSGDWAIVSAPYKTVNNNLAAGKVYAYRRFGSSWSWEQDFTLPGSQAFSVLGGSLDMMDNTFAAGAAFADPSGVEDSGSVLIAEANLVSGDPFFATWGTSMISASDKQPQDHFGLSVALSGQYLYVGAPDRDEFGDANVGAVYVFAYNGFASYQEIGKIVLPDLSAGPGTQFGKQIAVDGQNITITDGFGWVHRYWQPDPLVPGMPEAQGLRYKPAGASSTYGQSLARDGTDIVVGDFNHSFTPAGSEGAVYVLGAPAADDCANAETLIFGIHSGCTWNATNDGSANCAASTNSPDVWYKIVGDANNAGPWRLTTSSDYDSALSVHTGCPGTEANQIACNDDGAGNLDARIHFTVQAGQTYLVRVNGFYDETGAYELIARDDTCPADIAPPPMGDGMVNVDDLFMIINDWGLNLGLADIAPPPNGDGAVDIDDLFMVISAWGACP